MEMNNQLERMEMMGMIFQLVKMEMKVKMERMMNP